MRSKQELFYKIPVGKRYLYASTRQELMSFRDYFAQGVQNSEPTWDFPKLFYQQQKQIISDIDAFLKNNG
jgi:hypothetical protein